MPDLQVRGVDETLVRALKERAGAHGLSAEAEHREILAAALVRPRRRSFADVLASMPDVGIDTDSHGLSHRLHRSRVEPGLAAATSWRKLRESRKTPGDSPWPATTSP